MPSSTKASMNPWIVAAVVRPFICQGANLCNALIEKGHKFTAMIEQVHSISVSDPVVAGSSFACAMQLDVTIKGQGRMNMTELCVYEVKDGKIISEQFTSRFHV